MTVLKDEKKCTGCSLCAQICPVSCITMQPGEGGFLYPQKDMEKCIGCDKCLRECPVEKEKPVITPLTSYAFMEGDLQSRKKSASGGAAAVFAKAVLHQGGVYIGVRYDENMQAVHGVCEDEAELDLFRDSKYVQSNPAGIYEKIENALAAEKPVLVTGTPCQISAFRSYLKKDYDNLILCELICHGVPSPLVFKTYLREEEKKRGKKITGFYFRDKTNGWLKSNVKIRFADGSEEIVVRKECEFFRLFGNNMIFRESCHDCQFRNFQTAADLTIGDYWGIEKRYPDFTDDTGCSVVIVNNEKGKAFFDKVQAGNLVLETELDFVIETHSKLRASIPKSPYRTAYFKLLKPDGSGYRKAFDMLLGSGIFNKIKKRIAKGILR